MKNSSYTLLTLLLVMLLFACNENGTSTSEKKQAESVDLKADNLVKELQTALSKAKDGEVIELPAGQFSFQQTLVFSNIPNVTIKGQGKGKTILSFKEQVGGAEGLVIKSAKNSTLEGFSVQDTQGAGIKVEGCDKVTLRDLNATWTGGPLETNGAYGIYVVSSKNVRIEDCEASNARDAGVYLSQATNFIVQGNYAHQNVGGIEIGNSTNGEVYDNRLVQNTVGLLFFDLPDLPQVNGGNIKVYHNVLEENNTPNFSTKGVIAQMLPAGTGILLIGHSDLEVYENEIRGHQTLGLGVFSWLLTNPAYQKENFDPYYSNVNIYKNIFMDNHGEVDQRMDLGKLLSTVFEGKGQDIAIDGVFNPKHLDEKGKLLSSKGICIHENEEATFINLNAAKGTDAKQMAKNKNTKLGDFDCQLATLGKVKK